MEPLKNLYNNTFFEIIFKNLQNIGVKIDLTEFLNHVYCTNWEQLALKQRMDRVAKVLHLFLDNDFKKAIIQIQNLVLSLQTNNTKSGFEYIFIPHYVELFGQDHLEESIQSFEIITPFISCEFAIRPFIVTNQEYVLSKMLEWSQHPNEHLRRLASEGSRPRLPWAIALPNLKTNPKPTLPILLNLLKDDSLYVRKSVANHLNDISKDNPKILQTITAQHYGKHEFTNWILKHANRNLLKQGDTDTLTIFGFNYDSNIKMNEFKLTAAQIQLGEYLNFSFNLENRKRVASIIRIEYAIYYLKQNGSTTRKVFKISEKSYDANSNHSIVRKQHFKPISTRKYYFGIHFISIIINGKEFDLHPFNLTQ